jgi:hypothetical protein
VRMMMGVVVGVVVMMMTMMMMMMMMIMMMLMMLMMMLLLLLLLMVVVMMMIMMLTFSAEMKCVRMKTRCMMASADDTLPFPSSNAAFIPSRSDPTRSPRHTSKAISRPSDAGMALT